MRALSHGLAPVGVEADGLEHALRALADSTGRSTPVRCVFECPAPVSVHDPAAPSHLYRIAQEAVNNALKHAAPTEIRVGLEQRAGLLILEVDDDGDGYAETPRSSGGIGLEIMRHRAQLLGGTLEISSPPAGGTASPAAFPPADEREKIPAPSRR